MAGQSHEQRSTATCPNGWYRSDAKEIAVEMGWHVQRMNDNQLPKQIFYSELSSGVRNKGEQRKRYKDTLKQTLKLTGIDAETWHELAEDRTAWRKAVEKGVRSFEDDRVKVREDKRLKRKANEALFNKFLVSTLYVRHVTEPANQG